MEITMKNQLIMMFSLFGLLFSINLGAAEVAGPEKGKECKADEDCPPKEEMQEVQEGNDEKENVLDSLHFLSFANEDKDDDCIGDDCPKKDKESTENRAFADDQECDSGDNDCPKS
jgi:hypothetical protein